MRKLPVWSTVLGAYDFVWYERRPFLTLALQAIAILTILTGAIQATDPGLGLFMAVLGLTMLAELAFWVTFCVAWHRHYLVPGEVATIRNPLRWGRRQTRFLLESVRKVYAR